MNELKQQIRENAQLVIEQLGPFSDIAFGFNKESLEWVEGFIERQRVRPELDEKQKEGLVNVLGSFLGECIIAQAGGEWFWPPDEQEWSIVFTGNNRAYPFVKVRKQFAHGVEGGESIVSFYEVVVDYLSKGKLK